MAETQRTAKPWRTTRIAPEGALRQSGWRRPYDLVVRAIHQFLDHDCTTMAAALAFYATFSIAPLLLIVISTVGLVFGHDVVQHDIQSQIQGLIGPDAAREIAVIVEKAGQQSSSGIVGAALGIAALLVGATGAFSQIQTSLNRIWQVTPDPQAGGIRNFIGQRILSLGIVLALAFLLLVSLAVDAALSAFAGLLSAVLPDRLFGSLSVAIGFLIPLAAITALFAAIFKILPDARIAWRNVWIGAGITAILFTVGKFLIGLYLGGSGIASPYGAAGSFVLIVLWAYYSSIIFLFGAEFTDVWSEACSGPVQPKPGAVKTAR